MDDVVGRDVLGGEVRSGDMGVVFWRNGKTGLVRICGTDNRGGNHVGGMLGVVVRYVNPVMPRPSNPVPVLDFLPVGSVAEGCMAQAGDIVVTSGDRHDTWHDRLLVVTGDERSRIGDRKLPGDNRFVRLRKLCPGQSPDVPSGGRATVKFTTRILVITPAWCRTVRPP